MSAIIYRITNTVNGKFYIGQTTQGLEKRWYRHCYLSRTGKSNTHLHRAIRKYGPDAFVRELLEETITEQLDDRETYWIDKLHPDYNMTGGGEGGIPSEEVRSILRESALRRWKFEEYRERMKITHKGFLGKQHKPESNLKRSQSLSGKPKSIEHKRKLSESGKARWTDPEYREKMTRIRRQRNL